MKIEHAIGFIKNLFLTDLETGKKSKIIKIEGSEKGHEELRIFTQSAKQKKDKVATVYKIVAEEVIILGNFGLNRKKTC